MLDTKSYEEVLQSLPPIEAAYFRATNKLLHGNYLEGFKEYEIRFQTDHHLKSARTFEEPRWNGEPLDGKTIFVWNEQGIGDTLMTHRYIPMLEKIAGRVVYGPQKPLINLMRGNCKCEVPDSGAFVECDYQIPTLSLPRAFKTTVATIPQPVPIRHLKPFLMEMPETLNVGIQWAGNINHPDDMARSIPFAEMSRLLKVKGIKYWGLQRNIRPEEVLAIQDSGLTCLWFDGMEVLAAIVAKMDLIVTCDTALAHLAGCMGKPVWVLIQDHPDWRWMLKRTDTPWYPSMRLFRQRRYMEWRPVINHIIELLRRKREHAASSKH